MITLVHETHIRDSYTQMCPWAIYLNEAFFGKCHISQIWDTFGGQQKALKELLINISNIKLT